MAANSYFQVSLTTRLTASCNIHAKSNVIAHKDSTEIGIGRPSTGEKLGIVATVSLFFEIISSRRGAGLRPPPHF
jgi:hypothetical protein